MKTRILASLPLLVATALFTHVARTPTAAVIVVAGVALSLAIAPRLEVGLFVQRVTLLVVGIVGALVGGTVLLDAPGIGPTALASFWGTVALTTLFLALARRFFRAAEGGAKADFALACGAIVACGEKRTGAAYTIAAVLFVAAVIAALRAQDPRGTSWVVERQARVALGALVLLIATFTAIGVVSLPRIEDYTQHYLERVVFAASESSTGFTDRVRLGPADRILESNEMVMRVYGPHTDYLRGQVFDRYELGGWSTVDDASHDVTTVVGRPAGDRVIEIRAVGDSTGRERHPRYFIPLGAHRIGTARGFGRADTFGTLRPVEGEAPTPVYFEAGGPLDLTIAAPTDEDLRVPEDLRASLQELVAAWTIGAEKPRQKLAALERHLTHDFKYSLEYAAPERRDESRILHFLFHSRSGHCEYFATAMALLGRTAGVPVRLVGGYRVSEHNALGDYDVVREKNAHAWVEGWVDGSWQTFEPTPVVVDNLSHETSRFAALTDVIASTWDRGLDAIAQASLWQILTSLAIAVGLLTLVRRLRARRERAASGAEDVSFALPLPSFARLCGALGRRGHVRGASETLEQYAERLKKADLSAAAELVLSYGAHRYGDVGERRAVTEQLDLYVAQLSPK